MHTFQSCLHSFPFAHFGRKQRSLIACLFDVCSEHFFDEVFDGLERYFETLFQFWETFLESQEESVGVTWS